MAKVKPDPKTQEIVARAFNDVRRGAYAMLRDTEVGTDIGKSLRAVTRMQRALNAFVKEIEKAVK